MNCPLPISRVADSVGEILYLHSHANMQSEYGLPMENWLRDNNSLAQTLADKWWKELDAKTQRTWIISYRLEVETQIRDLQLLLTRLNDLL